MSQPLSFEDCLSLCTEKIGFKMVDCGTFYLFQKSTDITPTNFVECEIDGAAFCKYTHNILSLGVGSYQSLSDYTNCVAFKVPNESVVVKPVLVGTDHIITENGDVTTRCLDVKYQLEKLPNIKRFIAITVGQNLTPLFLWCYNSKQIYCYAIRCNTNSKTLSYNEMTTLSASYNIPMLDTIAGDWAGVDVVDACGFKGVLLIGDNGDQDFLYTTEHKSLLRIEAKLNSPLQAATMVYLTQEDCELECLDKQKLLTLNNFTQSLCGKVAEINEHVYTIATQISQDDTLTYSQKTAKIVHEHDTLSKWIFWCIKNNLSRNFDVMGDLLKLDERQFIDTCKKLTLPIWCNDYEF